MGLDISSQSDRTYHFSYAGIHYIRFMAYRSLGGQKVYMEWFHMHYEEPHYINIEQSPLTYEHDEHDTKSDEVFPNLMFHSDCEGSYTPKGKVNYKTGLTGNSAALLKELKYIKLNLPPKHDGTVTDRDWHVFNMLYDLVEDTVENHNGRLVFA